MGDLPSGTLTFLFTDLEGSTALWESEPEVMRDSVARHDELLAEAVTGCGGQVVKSTGDGMVAVFVNATDGVAAALACQQSLGAEDWPVPIRARMGLYTGEAEAVDGDYHSPVLNRAARLTDAGHGGQVLVSESTRALVAGRLGGGVELVDLGEHRLRDLATAERLYQMQAPELGGDFPALRTLDTMATNLPLQPSSFVGREAEQSEVLEALRRSRLVTLIGVGGVGKTRLALQSAGEVLPRFRDGVWLCELAPVRDADQVAEAVASVFGVSARPGFSLQESLVSFLRQEETLLVLDNCEHILRPVARLISAIQAECGGVRVLATSREGLSVAGEQMLMVAPLDIPEPGTSLDEAEDCEAIRLFVDRAGAHRADFELDDSNRADVVALCTRLDGVPLAIELAAARIPMMSPGEILRRLDRRFRLLSGGDRAGIERHQTLRAAVDWSYDLLTEAEQALLTRLAVFSGGWTLEAAESVCSDDLIDPDEVLDLLANLVARSLVVADPGLETRYRLLETIRQYAEEKLAETGETDQWRRSHADFFIDRVAELRDETFGPHGADAYLQFHRELDNLVAALAFAVRSADVDRAMALLRANDPRLFGDAYRFESAAVLALPGSAGHPEEPFALLGAAIEADIDGHHSQALELLDRAGAAEAALELANPAFEATRAGVCSWIYFNVGDSRAAAEQSALAAELAEQAGEPPGVVAGYLALYAMQSGSFEPEAALQRAQAALDTAQRSGTQRAIISAGLALAGALVEDDPGRARDLLHEYAEHPWPGANLQMSVAFTAARLADWPLALTAAAQGFELDRRSGLASPLHLTGVINIAARCLADTDPEGAAVLQGAARGLLNELIQQTDEAPALADTAAINAYTRAVGVARSEASEMLVAALGESRWRQLQADGEAMNREQAIRYATIRIRDHRTAAPPHPEPKSPQDEREATQLTDRQLEVAELVARGLSNKDIAKKLDVSPYTVETHVRNILERLDATNRAQIVAWVKDNQLPGS